MRKIMILILLALLHAGGYGQAKPKKIRIILLGTFHFNQSLDSASKLHSNIFSAARQREVDALVGKLVKQKPDKIFLEFAQTDQPYYDSIYNDYLKGKEPQKPSTRANEIFQLGMKTAKRLGRPKVTGINYQPQELADTAYRPANAVGKAVRDLYLALNAYEDTTRTNASFYDLPVTYQQPKQDSLLQRSSLSEFLLYLNTPKKLQRDEYINWNYYYSIGTGNDLSATDYVGTFWYGTNVRNFNNVLRQVDYGKDTCYLLIYGSSHIPFLTYLFSMHPYFEVVDLQQALK